MAALEADPDYALFVAAIKRASEGSRNFVSELSGTDKFTVFAPVNAAFANYLGGRYKTEILINEQHPDSVASDLVSYQIISQAYFGYELPAKPLALNEQALMVSKSWAVKNFANPSYGTNVVVNGIVLSRSGSNIMASNGIINSASEIFAVPSTKNLLQTIQENPALSFLSAAIERAGGSGFDVSSVLNSVTKTYTILAPTNIAFEKEGFVSIDVINETSPEILASLLKKHLFNGLVFSSSYPAGSYTLYTLENTPIIFDNTSGLTALSSNNAFPASVIIRDVITANGVFNTIDQLLK